MPNFYYKKQILIILALALLTVFYLGRGRDSMGAFVTFLDIGQGDSILVGLAGDTQIIIDGGPSNRLLSKLASHVPFYDKQIELVILSHPHADHMRGLNHLLGSYTIKNVLFSGAYYESGTYAEFIDLLESEGTNVYIARQGDKVFWQGEELLSILSPGDYALGKEFREIHQSNVVSKLSLGGLDFLLMGDADTSLEGELIRDGLLGDIDVLKVGHHGSKTSTSFEFLNTVLPETAVIQVGKNSYGHPNSGVLERLEGLGTKVLRNDQEGDIEWKFRMR